MLGFVTTESYTVTPFRVLENVCCRRALGVGLSLCHVVETAHVLAEESPTREALLGAVGGTH